MASLLDREPGHAPCRASSADVVLDPVLAIAIVRARWQVPLVLACVTRTVPLAPACHAQLPDDVGRRLRTGCAYEEQYDDTYSILVTRKWPRDLPEQSVREWWPMLAPSRLLLETPRGPGSGRMPWLLFCARYRAELDALSLGTQNGYLMKLGWLLRRYPA